jgi:Domain of unknown function (DUF4382)
MGSQKSTFYASCAIFLGFLVCAGLVLSCGGGSSNNMTPTTGTVTTTLSDPPTCAEYSHVYVTITKVTANINASAGPSDSGWQTLADLSSAPRQVDLTALNPTATPGFCGTLFTLGSNPLPSGTYQQLRLYLLANSASTGPSNNACGSAGFNCVVPKGSSTADELTLPSEVQTGIKIPSSQITSGGLTVTAGQSVDLNIDVNSCASVVKAGASGQYLLKPVLHAGQVSLNNNTISGKVVEGTGAPNPGQAVPNAIVLLEQPATTGSTTLDQVVMAGMTQSDGTFDFCPAAASSSNFDVVVTGQTTQTLAGITTTTTYNPSVVLGVSVGGSTASIPLFAETTTGSGTGLVTTDPATINGEITATSASSTPVAGSVQLSALQMISNGGNNITLTIPIFDASSTPADNLTDSQPPSFTTVATPTSACATTKVDCVAYSLEVPASAVAVGTYNSSTGNNVAAPSSTTQASYTVFAVADGSNGLLTCSPTTATSAAAQVSSGSTVDATTVPTLNFALTGCTAP